MTSIHRTLYADTQALIYAFRNNDAAWRDFIERHLDAGYRLVLTEEHLLEFSQWHSLDEARSLIRALLALAPVWFRSFADIQADEVHAFVAFALHRQARPHLTVFRETYESASRIGDRLDLNPEQVVTLFSSPVGRDALRKLRQQHADVLNELKRATASQQLTRPHLDVAYQNAVTARLARGSDLFGALSGGALADAVQFCVKKRKQLMRECMSFAAEDHLSNHRASNPRRIARLSDSVDLTASVAAFPYVDIFLTNDGFLHSGLQYVKTRMPSLATTLHRWPDDPEA